MDRDSIGLLLASTLAGLAVLLAVVALARQPFLLLVAVPFAVGAYLVWRGATGQFSWGLTGGRFREARREQERRQRERGRGGPRGPFEQVRDGGPFQQARGGGRSRGRTRQRATGARRGPGAQERAREALDRREAYRVLGLSPDADAAAVKAAYREQVKRVHPDAEGGDPEAFRKVTAAYETLRE